MRIIDSHVHCYPQKVIQDPTGWGRARNERHWVELVTQGPQGWADPETLLREMDKGGIEKVVLQSWYWERPETAIEQNQWHAEWVERYPDRFWAMAAIHPGMKDPVAVLEDAHSWGARGIGEGLPQVQSALGWQDPAWVDILSWTSQARWPFCLHVTEPVGHLYPGRVETSLEETVEQLERWPQQRWILAHWGGGLPFYTLNHRVRKATRNSWFDSAASPLLYNANVWRVLLQTIGPERMLFGSDFPLILYPRQSGHPEWGPLLGELRQFLSEENALHQVLSGNAVTLFEPREKHTEVDG